MQRPSGQCFGGVLGGSDSGWWQDGKEEEKEGHVAVGRLPLCEEENKKPGLDLEKYWETVYGFICILRKEEKNKSVKTVSAYTFQERVSRLQVKTCIMKLIHLDSVASEAAVAHCSQYKC